jgi:iron complex outermembrane receptor protein
MSRIKVLMLSGAAIVASPAMAQESAVRSATDAFGERVGIEQIGLYNEGQVRGFDLNASGAYRINDAYFSRAAPLNDPVLAGVGVRVGVNAARLAYPAPSGVVNYRLREPAATNQLTLGAGLRDFGTRTLEANGSWKTDDNRLGFAGGVVWRPVVQWGIGTRGEAFDIGLVGRYRLTENQTIQAFGSSYWREYDGDMGVWAKDGALPPNARRFHNYAPEWATVEATNTNFGVLYDGDFGPWAVDVSAFSSTYDPTRSDFTIIEADRYGDATAKTMVMPRRKNTSDSAEARVSRVFATGGLNHMISASVRARRSEVDLATNLVTPLGAFTLRTDPAPSVEPVWTGARGQDVVEQVTASAGYGLVWKDALQVRLGAHRTRYDKDVLTTSGVRTRGVEETTLFNASAIWSVTPRTAVFGSWVTGLEESGVAPNTATNALDVLPPVEAEQFELGVRHSVTPGLTFIGALFDVSKATPGFRADGSYGLVGQVRHRGVEGSLAGSLNERTNIVLGAVYFDPQVTGPLVDSGVVGGTSPGISRLVVNASIERQLGSGWSVDAQASYWSERWANTANTFKAPGVPQLNIGVRRRFEIAGRPSQLRAVVSNITNVDGYWASSGGMLWPIAERTARVMLSTTFGAQG